MQLWNGKQNSSVCAWHWPQPPPHKHNGALTRNKFFWCLFVQNKEINNSLPAAGTVWVLPTFLSEAHFTIKKQSHRSNPNFPKTALSIIQSDFSAKAPYPLALSSALSKPCPAPQDTPGRLLAGKELICLPEEARLKPGWAQLERITSSGGVMRKRNS